MVFEVNFLLHGENNNIFKRIFLGKKFNNNTLASIWYDKNYCEVYLPIIYAKKDSHNYLERKLVGTLLHEALHLALFKSNSPTWEDEDIIETLCKKIIKK